MESINPDAGQKLPSERTGLLLQIATGADGYLAFHPRPLPPDPPLRVDAELQGLLDRANQATEPV